MIVAAPPHTTVALRALGLRVCARCGRVPLDDAIAAALVAEVGVLTPGILDYVCRCRP